jgi:phage tail-like protein
LCWPTDILFKPFDMAPRAHGGVWILDRANRRYWALDRHLRIETRDQAEFPLAPAEPDVFQAAEGEPTHCTPARSFPEGISLAAGSPIEAVDPVSIEALPGEQVLLLDAGTGAGSSTLLRYCFGLRLPAPLLDQSPPVTDGSEEALPAAYDLAFVGAANAAGAATIGDLFIVAREGNQSFRFAVSAGGGQLWLESAIDYFPMRLFTGMGLVTAGGQAFYDSNGRWVPLVRQDRPQYALDAVILSPLFDGREPGCVWHRLLLDGCLPSGTTTTVWSRAADQAFDPQAEAPAWQLEPKLYQRGDGSELPYTERATSPQAGTFELLFQKAQGRFLQLKLELTGDGRATPRWRAARIYYPRFSYLTHYLPALYREEAISASFLERFLANLEGTNTALEDKIAAAQILFDLRSAPTETLGWLASWFGLALDPSWDELRQRLLLRNAMRFFQWRGTIHGLQMALHLAFDPTVDACIFKTPGASDAGLSPGVGTARPRSGGSACRSVGTSLPHPACARLPDPYRIVEQFLLRRAPAVVFGEPADDFGPLLVDRSGPWTPDKGVAELRRRYQEFIKPNQYSDFDLGLAPSPPEAAARAAFARRELGFEPSEVLEDQQGWRDSLQHRYATIDDLNAAHGTAWDDFAKIPVPTDNPANNAVLADWRAYLAASAVEPYGIKRAQWQDFLARRYGSIDQLNKPYGTKWPGLEVISYPTTLPANTTQLWDWYKFESLVLPTFAAAHRFSVLLPYTGQSPSVVTDRMQQLELARRVIELEKPAHTTFDVKFYWALFRLGDARLGLDTTLGLGGRDPALLPPPILGQAYLAETLLTPGYPFNVTERQLLDRDRLN